MIIGLIDKVKESLKGSGFYDWIGEEYFFFYIEDVIYYVENVLNKGDW